MRIQRRLLSAVLALGLLAASVLPGAGQEILGTPIGLVQHPTLGTILTDRQGLTLYTWEGDVPGVSNCADACATAWPPAVANEASVMAMLPGVGMDDLIAGPSSSGLGVIMREVGSWQLTLNGMPLYRFQRDAQPGDANGQGSMGFGARWAVVTLSS